MARFIKINVTAAGTLANGIHALNVDDIFTVYAATATTTLIHANNTLDVTTVTHDSVGTTPSVRDAIVNAMTANPGGVSATVNLPSTITVTAIATA
jgi:hypothetical protein|tara:strand:+ start:707 stop:994 length:288 start_codon:yes stop_codon:yes gene_type:complete